MALYGHILNGVVVALNTQAAYDATHASVQNLWTVIPNGTQVGATANGSGGWTNPAADTTPPVVTPMQFYTSFTPAERIAIKASTNQMVQEFWDTYERAERTGSPINLGLISVVEGINYMATPAPGVALLAPARVAQILAGTPQ